MFYRQGLAVSAPDAQRSLPKPRLTQAIVMAGLV